MKVARIPLLPNLTFFSSKRRNNETQEIQIIKLIARNPRLPLPQVAWLQTAGHKGLSSEHKNYFGLTGAGVGLATAVVLLVLIGGIVLVVVWGGGKIRRQSNSSSIPS